MIQSSFDPLLLRTFLAVAETRHFTAAGQRLGLSQSTVSQHIRRLEEQAGRPLLLRDTHSVTLTTDGEAMRGFATTILEAHARAAAFFAGTELRGRLRFGTSEDLVSSRLPEILREFVRSNPAVDLDLTVGLSALLYDRLDAGELDLICAKRRPGERRGRPVWRERLAWIGTAGTVLDPSEPLPLVAYPNRSITRALALEALERAGRRWRMSCSSGSLSGLTAAVLAGLGVTAQSRLLLGGALVEIPGPELDEVEFVVTGRGERLHGAAAALADVILLNATRLQPAG
ncbi:Transcriptional regulator, LysR family [Roseomonas mucosa]|uniref:Transcriptional regulator, LysR family n=2 Tax=Roseomonas mucosa TaxID=207340 RepID=A0A4Y1MV89_9PROT|nr:LysR substrate-binding domain-containing protein [Roseomonas mucosa]AWV21985.1 Transcriptional regulator, LysR family [Roseomonas mucosa]MDT8275486.1 LysR substrate-binding domain-containing protein [Roseomonas mucosa]MDT8354984.1 LysR substrate-binding domain-containing protein [Roseomonas mucosa]MDU7521682.1 LysR substrate-binding domain-containing protein [Roseomonas mucosa]